MIPDVRLRDYYLHFIHGANIDLKKYNEELENVIKTKSELYKFLEDNKQNYYDKYHINLDAYTIEYVNKVYNPKKVLYLIGIKYLKSSTEDTDKSLIINLVKYCLALYNEYKLNRQIELCNIRKEMKPGVYRNYVTKFFNQVHKCVLSGMGYKFDYGIGTYVINLWKLDPVYMKKKPHLDYRATYLKKQELLKKGVKIYDDKEAAWYGMRGIPYVAVDYRVYRTTCNWYEFTFIKPKICSEKFLEYKRVEYVSVKYRGMNYQKIADDFCKCEEDIYALQVDIRNKLNILTYKNNTTYLNFIRDAEQSKYKR